jgi:hypothetical protein
VENINDKYIIPCEEIKTATLLFFEVEGKHVLFSWKM